MGEVRLSGDSDYCEDGYYVSRYNRNISVTCVVFFFFSSRRRHTRLQGDWSSDVCSSDLAARPGNALRLRQEVELPQEHAPRPAEAVARARRDERFQRFLRELRPLRELARSEEHTSELQSPCNLVCRLLLEKKKMNIIN